MPEQKTVPSVQPPSINDSLPSGNPSGKTVLMVLGAAVVFVAFFMVYAEYFQ